MSSLNRLLTSQPSWTTLIGTSEKSVDVIARPHDDDIRDQHLAYDLIIETSLHGGVTVREREPKTLPNFCIQRHINADGTFCLSLGSTSPLARESDAAEWWDSLKSFLRLQRFAHRFGFWPPGSEMSHGDAAYTQLEMEALADPLGWKNEIIESMFLEDGWLSGELPRLSRNGQRVADARSPCPRRCTQSCRLPGQPGSPNNETPMSRTSCPNRNVVEKLIRLEHRRRREEAIVLREVRRKNIQCCGSMERCSLRDV